MRDRLFWEALELSGQTKDGWLAKLKEDETLTPEDLIELGTELVMLGTERLKDWRGL